MSIYKKLFEAKKEIGKISKDAKNPFFKSNYLSLNGLIDAVEEVLVKHDLLLLQPIEDGKVKTQIFDIEEGRTSILQSAMDLPNITDPQKLGSAITYYRRYTLQSLLGLQAEDDDGNLAAKKKPVVKELTWLSPKNIDAAVKYAKENKLKANDLKKFYKIRESEFNILKTQLG
jgi:hypothetical protein